MLTRVTCRLAFVWSVLLTALSLAASAQNALHVLGLNSDFQLGFNYINPVTSPQLSKATGTGLSAGVDHSLSIRSGGEVWTWGVNSQGQLGDGTTIDRTAPVQVKGLSSITAVSAGGWHSLALRSDGTVWAWGRNNEGQVGDATFINRSTPVRVTSLSGIIAISAGRFHSLALKSDGTVWAWGENGDGQLGINNNTDQNVPLPMLISGATGIAAGGFHSLVIKSGSPNTVWATGSNSHGQIGDATYTYRNSPVQVSSLTGVAKVSGGFDHSLALLTNGGVRGWGYNPDGQLGTGSNSPFNANTPQTTNLGNVSGTVVDIEAGDQHNLLRTNSGTLYAWGDNASGRVGDGTQTDRSQPVLISGISNVSVLAPGDLFTLALQSDGTIHGWGSNDDTRLALVGVAVQQKFPLYNPASTEFVAISSGGYHVLGLKADGTVWAWGNNSNGQLGDGTTTYRSTPVQVSSLSSVTAISAGRFHSLARLSNGTVWSWGRNNEGQLGINSTTSQSSPVQMLNISGAAGVAAGGYHSLILLSDGTARSTGGNWVGQLGNGFDYNQKNSPGTVTAVSNAVALAAGEAHSLALINDGTIRCWGSGQYGQLGFGNNNNTNFPGNPSITGVASISAGNFHSLLVRTNGTLLAFGRNNEGQLGDGTTIDRNSAVQVSSITTAAAAAGAEAHSLTILSNGTVRAWGRNANGQLGDGTTTTPRTTPVTVINPLGVNQLTRALQAAGGVDFSIILRSPATVPALTSLSQVSASAGSAGFTLTATGSNFSALDSEILWNGVPLTNVSRSATSISATVPASYLASVGSASVTVGTPDDTQTGGYAQSDPISFTVTTAVPANPNLVLSILSVKRNGTTVTVAFALTNRGAQTANGISISQSQVTLGSLTPDSLVLSGNSAAQNAYIKGTATFSSVPNTEQQRFSVRGTYTYGSPTKTGSFAALQRIKVP
jgi:alpha-tubulin suppressor-like RCC1 family protein